MKTSRTHIRAHDISLSAVQEVHSSAAKRRDRQWERTDIPMKQGYDWMRTV